MLKVDRVLSMPGRKFESSCHSFQVAICILITEGIVSQITSNNFRLTDLGKKMDIGADLLLHYCKFKTPMSNLFPQKKQFLQNWFENMHP